MWGGAATPVATSIITTFDIDGNVVSSDEGIEHRGIHDTTILNEGIAKVTRTFTFTLQTFVSQQSFTIYDLIY